jgi:hypothetical protein
MIQAAIDAACTPLREVIARLAELLADADPVRDPKRRIVGYRLTIAADLARRLVSAG